MTKEERIEERDNRRNERLGRIKEAQERQMRADMETYGADSEYMKGKSSAGGNIRGGIWDVDTSDYKPKVNRGDYESDINMTGIDQTGGLTDTPSEPSSDITFNGSVAICINGVPYYIDIAYDNDTGAYPVADGANFPINAP